MLFPPNHVRVANSHRLRWDLKHQDFYFRFHGPCDPLNPRIASCLPDSQSFYALALVLNARHPVKKSLKLIQLINQLLADSSCYRWAGEQDVIPAPARTASVRTCDWTHLCWPIGTFLGLRTWQTLHRHRALILHSSTLFPPETNALLPTNTSAGVQHLGGLRRDFLSDWKRRGTVWKLRLSSSGSWQQRFLLKPSK